jgi:MFS family permease
MGVATTSTPLRRNRDFQLMWIGGMLAGLGSVIGTFALPLLVLQETGSAAKAGLVGSVSAATLLIVIIPAGAVADAVERRRLMMGCQLVGTAIAVGLSVTVLGGHPALMPILIATAVIAVLGSLYTPAATALLRAAVPADQLGLALSRLQARTAAVQIAGPLAGGVLFALSPALPLTIRAGALLASVACLLAVRARSVPAPTADGPLTLSHLTGGLRFVWRQRYLRVILIVFGAGLSSAFSAVMLVALTTSVQSDPSGRSSGVLLASTAAGSLVGALLAPRLRPPDRPHRVLVLTCWTSAAIVPVLAVFDVPLVMGALLGVVMLIAAVGHVAFEVEVVRLVPGDLIGRAEAAMIFISMAAGPVGPLTGGLLIDRFGHAVAFLMLGIVIAVLATVLTLWLRRCTPGGSG